MPKKIVLDLENLTLKEIFAQADSWNKIEPSELTAEQLAILNLKRAVELKKFIQTEVKDKGGASVECPE